MDKKIIIPALLVSVLTFGGCVKEVENREFGLYATAVDSKTVNDGMNTLWQEADQVNVFHAQAGTASFVNDGCFAVTDVQTGYLSGTLGQALASGNSYDWYVFYPYKSGMTSPASGTKITVGSDASGHQTQNGNSSMAHICGPEYPLCGKAAAVMADDAPVARLSQLATLIKVEVTNALSEALVVNSLSVTAETPLVGEFNIALGGAGIELTALAASSSKAALSVTGADALASGASATYFLAVAPFTAAAGSTLKFEVAGTTASGSSVQTREIQFAEAVSFASGKIKTVPVNYAQQPVPEKKDTFDPNNIVQSFAVLSDVHLDKGTTAPTTKFVNALNQLNTLSGGLDAVLVNGDMVQAPGYNGGSDYSEITLFKNTYESVFNPVKVPMIYCLGNHDVPWNSMMTGAAKVRNLLGNNYYLTDKDNQARLDMECRHCQVGDTHILCISPVSTVAAYNPAAVKWLDDQLASITAANPESYVIVLTHPMIYNTVYGSTLYTSSSLAWYTTALTSVLGKYNQVIVFGGHLHFPLNDPTSIWQGAFTSCGTASVRYMAIENGGYVDMATATTMLDKDEYSEGYLFQKDRSGNVRLTRMDFYRSSQIGEPWDISYPRATGEHLKKYNFAERSFRNSPPVMSGIKVNKISLGNLAIYEMEMPSAVDDEFAHHYEVEVRKGSSRIISWKILSDFYRNPKPSDMKKVWKRDIGSLGEGSYTISAKAYDSWGAVSNTVSSSFTVEATPPGQVELYVDVDFSEGNVSDSKDHAILTNVGSTITKTAVSHAGKSYTVPTAHFDGSRYIAGKFKDINTSAKMQAFCNQGFTAEVLYVDKSPGPAVHGVFCATEYGGWGLAIRATGVPYFIVGDTNGSSYLYKNADATSAASKTELTHLVGVYDYNSKAIKLYVNGVLVKSASITGPFFPGSGDAFNRFILGGDTKDKTVAGEFPPTNMDVVDAKFYSGALDASAVAKAYTDAINSLK